MSVLSLALSLAEVYTEEPDTSVCQDSMDKTGEKKNRQLSGRAPNPESLKNPVKSRAFELDIAAVRPQEGKKSFPVQQALISS